MAQWCSQPPKQRTAPTCACSHWWGKTDHTQYTCKASRQSAPACDDPGSWQSSVTSHRCCTSAQLLQCLCCAAESNQYSSHWQDGIGNIDLESCKNQLSFSIFQQPTPNSHPPGFFLSVFERAKGIRRWVYDYFVVLSSTRMQNSELVFTGAQVGLTHILWTPLGWSSLNIQPIWETIRMFTLGGHSPSFSLRLRLVVRKQKPEWGSSCFWNMTSNISIHNQVSSITRCH